MNLLPVTILIAVCCEVVSAQGPVAPVVVAPIEEREVRPTRLFVGDVRPTREVLVGTDVAGRVVDYPIDEGLTVEAGDVLAGLRDDQLEFQLEAARAELRTLEAQLEELRNGSRPEEIAQASARLAAAKAEEELRSWQLEKAEELYRTETVAEDQLREAQWNAAVATARRIEAEQALRLAREGPRDEVKAQAAGRVAAQRARVELLEDELARHVIRAPFHGSIVEERTEAGAWLRQGDPVARIVALDTVDVELPVPEDFVTGLSLGQQVVVRLPALGGQEFAGEIHAITPLADLRARTFPVRIRIPNLLDDGVPRLKAGMFAQARLPTGVPQRALTVPKDALVLGGDRTIVYVVGDDSLARAVAVEVGEAVDGEIVVRGADLGPGMRVVVQGNERLRPGQPVEVTEAATKDAPSSGR
jgi:multidrug efflux pump subunit AcrA (membrane-fusion protein)